MCLWDDREVIRRDLCEFAELWSGKIKRNRYHKYTVEDGGEKVKPPSVTQVLSTLGAGNYLAHWAAKLQREYLIGTMYEAYVDDALIGDSVDDFYAAVSKYATDKRPHETYRRYAADSGTEFHSIVENETRKMMGLDFQEIEVTDRMRPLVKRWFEWVDDVEFYPVGAECYVYSKSRLYAGQVDAIGFVNRKLVVIDWKTSNRFNLEFVLQNQAYRHAILEMGWIDDRMPGYIARFPRDGGVWSSMEIPVSRWEYDDNAWLAVQRLWKWHKESESLVK